MPERRANTLGGVKRPTMWTYLRAAFHAKPRGMWFPPNWGLIAGAALLGFLNPGFWAIGAGLELAYLILLASSGRFRRVVDADFDADHREAWQEKLDLAMKDLNEPDRRQFATLERACRQIMDEPGGAGAESADLHAHKAQGLGRLLWIYLQLLLTRQSLVKVLESSLAGTRRSDSLDIRLADVKSSLTRRDMDENLRRSLQGQLDILQQRINARNEAGAKLRYLESELVRIQEQVQLIREQSLLAHEPGAASGQIDAVASSLGETTQWIKDQRRAFGLDAEVFESAPPILSAGRG
jgi:hypothetical protein